MRMTFLITDERSLIAPNNSLASQIAKLKSVTVTMGLFECFIGYNNIVYVGFPFDKGYLIVHFVATRGRQLRY